jgi:hypothetical protein
MHCENPEECPVKLHPQVKNCWEVSFLQNNWEKVFEKCRNCKVFKMKSNKLRENGQTVL